MRTKRLLSLVMALCMLFTITAPGFAWALEDDAEPGEVITDVGPQQEDPVVEEPAPDPEPDPEPEEPEATVTRAFSKSMIAVFYTDSDGWDGNNRSIKVHYWNGSDTTAWPGVEMTWLFDNNYNQSVYGAVIPSDVTGIIFNNKFSGEGDNSGNKTGNITTGIADGAWWRGNGVFIKNTHVAASAETCGTAGNVEYYALDKNYDTSLAELTDTVIPATDAHTWDLDNPVWGELVSNGYFGYQTTITFTCTTCRETTSVVASGGMVKEMDPNCAEPSYTFTVCTATFGGREFSKEYRWDEGSVDPTAHPFILEAQAAVPATCTTAGNSAYWSCSGFNKYFSDAAGTTEITDLNDTIIAALGHDMGEWTYGENGATRNCSRCEYSETVAYPQAVVTDLSVADPVTANGDDYQLAKLVRFDFANGQPTQDQLDVFGNWYCDYVVYADHDVPANSMGLYGAYGELAQVLTSDQVIPANQEIILVNGVMNVDLRFKDIDTFVRQFTCGAFDVNYINAGTTLYVELRIWDDAGHTRTIKTMTHTFASAPVATVMINGGEPQPVDAPVTVTVTDATVTFTAAAAEALAGEGALTLTVTKTALNEHSATFTIELKNASNENVFTTESGNAAATVSIPWTGAAAPKVFLNTGAGLTEITPVTFENGLASFTVPHFSVYTVYDASCVASYVDANDALVYTDSLQEAITNAKANTTVTLVDDIADLSTVTIPAGKAVTLDLAGYSVEAGLKQTGRHYYAIDNYGTFTLTDSVGGGYIAARGVENLENGVMTINGGEIRSIDTNGGAAIWNEGTLYISGGTLRATYAGSSSDQAGPGCLNNSGTATITKGSFISVSNRTYAIISSGDITIEPASDADVVVSGAHGALAIDGGTADVKGGTYTASNYYGLYVSNDGTGTNPAQAQVTVSGGVFTGGSVTHNAVDIGSDVNDSVNSTIEITGGTFNGNIHAGNDVVGSAAAPAIEIKGGTINGTVTVDTRNPSNDNTIISVSGGTFNSAVPVKYCADGFIPEATTEGGVTTYGVKSGTYVAQIGNAKYETFEAAWNAAADGDTIKLLADCAGNGLKAPQGKYTTGLTVDFDGHTYTVTGNLVGSTGTETQAFQLLKENKITFKNGTITSAKAKMLVQNYSNLTLDNMTLDGANLPGSHRYVLSNNNGNVVIKDTTITAKSGDVAFDVCRYSSYPSVNVTVTGNSKINGDVEVSASGNDPKDGMSLTLEGGSFGEGYGIVVDASAAAAMAATPDKVTVTKAAGFTADAPEGYRWVSDNSVSTLTAIPYVAQNTTTNKKYETLAEAIAEVGSGETIKMIANVTNAPGMSVASGKNFTVDFDNHTYTVSKPGAGSTGTETSAFQLLKDSTIVFKNGTISVSEDNLTEAVAPAKNILRVFQNYANLTLDNMTIDARNQYGYYLGGKYGLSFNNGTSVIKDTTIITSGNDVVAFDVYLNDYYTATSVSIEGTSAITGTIEVAATSAANGEKLALTLTGGTLSGAIKMGNNAAEATITKADTFTQEAPTGYVWVAGETAGTQTIAKAVAQIGNTAYASLEAAVAAAVDGNTITLLGDCEGNGIVFPQGKFGTNGLTIDFDGHTYNVSGTPVGSTGTETIGFQLLKDNNITLKDGTLTGSSRTNRDLVRMIQNYSNLTLDNMIISLVGQYYNQTTMSNCNGATVINNSTVNAPDFTWANINDPASVGGAAFSVGTFSTYTAASVAVTGTSTINGDVKVDPDNNYAANNVLTLTGGTLNGDIIMVDNANEATVTKADTFEQEAPADYEWVDNGNGTSTLVAIEYVASITKNEVTTKYRTLEAAFAAAQDDDTITLLADVALTERLFVNAGANPAYGGTNNRYATTSENKAITLDLNGHNITSSSNIALAGGSLNITGTGTISTNASDLAPIEIRGTGDLTNKRTLTIGEDVTLTGSEYGLNVFGSNTADKNVIDVTVNGTVNGILFVLGNLKNAQNEINIEVNGKVAAPAAAANESPNVGIALNGVANVTVNEGAAVSGDSGIEVRAGSLTVNGGTITANAVEYGYTANGSGSTTKGAAIAVAQHTTAKPVAVVLNGGTLTGVKQIGVTDVNDDMSNVTVTATQSFTQNSAIPEGYEWVVTATPGTYTLEEIPVEVAAFKALGAGLALEGKIIVRIVTTPVENSTVNYVTLTINGRTRNVLYASPDHYNKNTNEYIFDVAVHAKEMNDMIVLKAFDENDNQLKIIRRMDGQWVESDEYTYSVMTYVNLVGDDEPYKNLVDAMSIYGDYAKYYFDHPYDNVSMEGNLSPIPANVLENYKAVKSPETWDGPKYMGGALALEEGTYLRVIFTGPVDGYTFTCGNNELEPVAYGNMFYVNINNVAAKDLDTWYTIIVTNNSTHETYTVQYCALSYVRTVINSNSTSQTLKDAMTALYWYNREANGYFEH